MNISQNLNTHLQLLGMAALWGASWPAARILAQAAPPFTAGAWRFTLSVTILLVWWFAVNRVAPKLSTKQWLGLVAGGLVGVFGYNYFFMVGVTTVPAGRASLVVTLNPVLTTLAAAWLFKETINRTIAVGMALAFAGAITVLSKGNPMALIAGDVGSGELLLLGCSISWCAYTLMSKRLLQGMNSLTATTFTSVFGWLALAAMSATEIAPPISSLGQLQWGAMAFLAIGSTALAYLWYFNGIARLGAGTAASYLSIVPVFAVLGSAALLGERIDGTLVVGGIMAVAGVMVMNWARREPAKNDL